MVRVCGLRRSGSCFRRVLHLPLEEGRDQGGQNHRDLPARVTRVVHAPAVILNLIQDPVIALIS
jgi:hypothetical protein